MALIPEPIFYNSLRRNSGAKRKLIHINNPDDEDVTVQVTDLEKPEWVELEGIYPGTDVVFKRKTRTPVVVNINTTHRYFPTGASRDEKIRIHFSNDTHLDVSITLPQIQETYDLFRGAFAVDFGTTNSCFGYKGGAAERGAVGSAGSMAKASAEIPSVIFFHDVSDARHPKFSIGTEARFDIKENSWQTYSYSLSVKRMLGQGKTQLVLDRLAGVKREHQREWSYEQIASFIIREIIERAQEEIGGKITSVIATFPPMFSSDRKDAIRSIFTSAFKDLGVETTPEDIVMHLDEANAAAFNYIYGTMLDEFRRFQIRERECDLLSYDFGGGTIDISLVGVKIERDAESGKIAINTRLKGLSGEANYGGDNVTLDVFSMLKKCMALKASEARESEFIVSETEGEGGDEDGASSAADDIWASLAAGDDDKDDDAGDIWGDDADADEAKADAAAEEEDEELRGFQNNEPPEAYVEALKTLHEEREIIESTITSLQSIHEATSAKEKADGTYVSSDQTKARAEAIEAAIETILPTRYRLYEDRDPHKVEIARKLFHELWHEADLIKIRMSVNKNGQAELAGTMKKAAKYCGIDPVKFNELAFEMKQLEAQIGATVEATFRKAKALYDGAQASMVGGLVLGTESGDAPELRVLLFGNSSNLPIVRRKALEVFGIDQQYLVMDKELLKSSVARGACEEQALRKAFGKGGLIQYDPAGFLDRIPYAVGLCHSDLGLMGFEKGFCPIFDRGVEVGSVTILTPESNFLIHDKMTDLAVFTDYKDGSDPMYQGWFDFTSPTPDDKIPARAERKLVRTLSSKPADEDDAAPEPEQAAAGGGLSLGAGTESGGGLSLGGGDESGASAGGGGLSLGGDATPAAGDAGEQPADQALSEGFQIHVELLPSRELLATNPATGEKYLLKIDQTQVADEGNPFAGVH